MSCRLSPPLPARIAAVCLSALACTAASTTASAADPDPWFGHDKVLHFGASATIAAGGYTIGAFAFDARYQALLLGGGLALGAGIGKEAHDAMGYGDPSWRDFVWDVAGTAAGLGLAWGLDLVLRGSGPEHPVFAVRHDPLSVSATLRF